MTDMTSSKLNVSSLDQSCSFTKYCPQSFDSFDTQLRAAAQQQMKTSHYVFVSHDDDSGEV